MSYLNEQLLKKARDFIKSCLLSGTEQDQRTVLIAYHGDGDGCCAAYFLQKYIGCQTLFYWVGTPDFDFVKAEKYITGQRPFLSIFLDMPVFNRPQMIEWLSSQGSVFVYDHHQPEETRHRVSSPNVLYINPVIHQGGDAFPTSLFAWELLEEKAHFEKEILFMGLFTETWLDRISLFEEFSDTLQNLLKQIARRIHGNFLIQDMSTTHYALNFLLQAMAIKNARFDHLVAIKEYQILENIYGLIQNEKKWLLKGLSSEIKKLRDPSFILKKIESKIRLCGLIASELRWRYPHLVIGIWQKWKERYYCELRRGRHCKIDLALLIKQIKAEVELITGGGHPEAAAFTAQRDCFFQALNSIRSYVTKNEL